jgi:hypothetical protein
MTCHTSSLSVMVFGTTGQEQRDLSRSLLVPPRSKTLANLTQPLGSFFCLLLSLPSSGCSLYTALTVHSSTHIPSALLSMCQKLGPALGGVSLYIPGWPQILLPQTPRCWDDKPKQQSQALSIFLATEVKFTKPWWCALYKEKELRICLVW